MQRFATFGMVFLLSLSPMAAFAHYSKTPHQHSTPKADHHRHQHQMHGW